MLKLNPAWRLLLACVFVAALAAQSRAAAAKQEGVPIQKGLGIAVGMDNVFSPCGSGKSYWLSGEQSVMLIVRAGYAKSVKVAGEHVYMELRGRIGPKMQEGASAKLDGIFRVEEVVLVRSRGASECGGKAR